MSSSAYASGLSFDSATGAGADHRRSARRRAASAATLRARRMHTPDGSVRSAPASLPGRPRTSAYVWWLVGAAIALHVAGVWYLHTRPDREAARPRTHEVAIALERPQPPPKIEPPRRPPARTQPPRPVQALPQIETAAPQPSELDAAPAAMEAVSPPVPPAAPSPPAELPVTAPFGRAGYLDNPPPSYPTVAMRQGWQGTVVLKVRVLASGRPASVEVQKSSGRKVLDDAAVQTVQGWSFSPAKRGDAPVDGWATVPIEFRI